MPFFEHQISTLANAIKSSCFFYRGYGESDHPKGRDQYKLSYLVNDVKEMVRWNLYSKCNDLTVAVLMTHYEMQTIDIGVTSKVLII